MEFLGFTRRATLWGEHLYVPLCLWGLPGVLFYEVDGDYEESTLLRFMVLMRRTFMRFMGCIRRLSSSGLWGLCGHCFFWWGCFYEVCRVYEENIIRIMGVMRTEPFSGDCIYDFYDLYDIYRLYKDWVAINFVVLRKRAPIWGLWSLGGECLYDLYGLCGVKGLFEFYGIDEENFFLSVYGNKGVYDETIFKRFMAFMGR